MREREMRFLRAAKLRVMLPLLGVGLYVEGCATGNATGPGRAPDSPKDAGADGYRLVFDSAERRLAFQESPLFDDLLREVDQMHGNLRRGLRQCDAKSAVCLAP